MCLLIVLGWIFPGSGDAQTLCITDDDNVWSFGDGDYGKLGRGGSDGCKVPLKIDSLAGLGVFKVIFRQDSPRKSSKNQFFGKWFV